MYSVLVGNSGLLHIQIGEIPLSSLHQQGLDKLMEMRRVRLVFCVCQSSPGKEADGIAAE
jgi:hypothetical protein